MTLMRRRRMASDFNLLLSGRIDRNLQQQGEIISWIASPSRSKHRQQASKLPEPEDRLRLILRMQVLAQPFRIGKKVSIFSIRLKSAIDNFDGAHDHSTWQWP